MFKNWLGKNERKKRDYPLTITVSCQIMWTQQHKNFALKSHEQTIQNEYLLVTDIPSYVTQSLSICSFSLFNLHRKGLQKNSLRIIYSSVVLTDPLALLLQGWDITMLGLFWGKFLHLDLIVARGGALGTHRRLLIQLSLRVYCKNDCGDDCDNEWDNIRNDLHGS